MSYIINNSRGQVIAVVADGTVNTSSTSLALVGRAVTSYGEYENENYVYLLENFANSSPPLLAILGQLWYNSSTDTLSVYDSANTWTSLASQTYVEQQKISPIFTGVPQAPTAPSGTANAQIATTGFVQTAVNAKDTVSTPSYGDNSTRIATTAFVQGEKLSPTFTGTPLAPTASPGTATSQIATTAFVTNSPQFAGVPTAPTAASGTNTTQIATTAFVTNSPQFAGVPRAPTATTGTANTQIATTAFVYSVTGNLGTVSQQNSNSISITGGTITGIDPLPVSAGGTASSTALGARTNLGLGDMAVQSSSAVGITGGSITGINPLPVASGGTGANTAAQARQNLDLQSMALQKSDEVFITGGRIFGLEDPLPVDSGGTGAATEAQARVNLGLGSISTQNANAVSITGGTIAGINPLSINSGGTGASTAEQARINLGLGSGALTNVGTMASQNANAVAITGGTITGITPLPVVAGGTGAGTAGAALTNLGAVPFTRTVSTNSGLTGGGSLATNLTIGIAVGSNGFGNRIVSAATPSGGSDGDIWYQI